MTEKIAYIACKLSEGEYKLTELKSLPPPKRQKHYKNQKAQHKTAEKDQIVRKISVDGLNYKLVKSTDFPTESEQNPTVCYLQEAYLK